ncbi:hypothetical protein [Burkholderia sp. Bp8998]|uniref:hypothetical protein n=1 Tax=Burkholderia sp. Bp8998 TaxID=2184557 RepID=UPI000F560C92|nr:hypothetical protein [Burkholderia sp. Bp8998]RQR63853.1 hypothetical protein DIE18_06900 [Burkholderia sp. Bp9125]RQS17094.1 hypothetical protein DIE06_18105 [Burkholderia sp. Bp8998]
MEPTTTTTKNSAAPKKNKGGNDGKSPRALRGAPKAASNWSAADEARFQEQQKAREAFVAERTTSLKKIAGLMLHGVKPVHIEAVKGADGTVITEGYALPVAATEEQLLANLAEHGDAILTYLSKHYKLQPTLLKSQ